MKMHKTKITYSQVGDDYSTKDPIKKLAQSAAKSTGINLTQIGFKEVSETRGESAYVWKQDDIYMASVSEGLGTKNLVADKIRKIINKTYYDIIGHDTVATIINDLVTVGAKPLTVHAYWGIEDNSWLADEERMSDLIKGWSEACNLAGCSWGGGETPTLKGVVVPGTIDLGGSAVGIITSEQRLILDKKLKSGDRILFLKSNGINTNGLSLARAVADRLAEGYSTIMNDGSSYGEGILTKTNIYAKLIQDLLDARLDIHYISNITGHGLRKVMRSQRDFTYIVEKIFDPQEIFLFIQKNAGLDDYEMYGTYNMGQDYAIFLPEKDMAQALQIVKQNRFEEIDAGFIEEGERQVIIKPKNITFKGETLNLR